MSNEKDVKLDAHDTHCCIEHGCKYGDADCAVANGIRKQVYLCERCGRETEGYYGHPERTRDEQKEYIDALWDDKHNPRDMSPLEKGIADIARRHGRLKVLAILSEVDALPFTMHHMDIQIPETIDILKKLKEIK